MRMLDAILADFELIEDWEERYRYLIDLGKTLTVLSEEEKVDSNRVPGCVAHVWLVLSWKGETLFIKGASDAHIVRGLVALIFAIYNGKRAREIITFNPEFIFKQLHLKEHLTLQRSNGLNAIVARIQKAAQEFISSTKV